MEKRKTVQCSACGRRLDPNSESVIYIGQTPPRDRESHPGPVFAVCGSSREQSEAGTVNPCVAATFKVLRALRISPIPSNYQDWLNSTSRGEETPFLPSAG